MTAREFRVATCFLDIRRFTGTETQAFLKKIDELCEAYASHVTAALKERAEQTDVQLAGCSVAAFGGTSDAQIATKGMYGWSASYQDVLDLRLKFEAAESRVEELEKALREATDILVRMLAIGGENFASLPMECYCGSVMDDEGELDSESFCLPCLARKSVEIARKALKGEKG